MNSQKIVQDNPNQLPLGAQFKDFELNSAVNYYTLDPFQYAITKFDYKLPDGSYTTTKPNDTGLIYKGLEINKLLPSFTATKKSVNDFPAQSYHRFLANDGYFNPQESLNNDDLWYYGANPNGAGVNVQEVNHIIFPEAQRGGLNSTNLAKYSWTSDFSKPGASWESQNVRPVNNDQNCEFFNYNQPKSIDFNKVYSFDSNYCRSINISGPDEGSMPFSF